jgi:hypothetical protein
MRFRVVLAAAAAVLTVVGEAGAFSFVSLTRVGSTPVPSYWFWVDPAKAAAAGVSPGQIRIAYNAAPNLALSGPAIVALGGAVAIWNARAPVTSGNVQPAGGSGFDTQSRLLHELGLAMGLARPNVGGPAPAPASPDIRRFTQSAAGASNGDCTGASYVTGSGPDGIPGTADDNRGPAVAGSCTTALNPSLFLANSDNNPFEPLPAVVDSTTYSFDGPFQNHPGYAQTSTREVAGALGLGATEAVMVQGIHAGERLTALAQDDFAGIRYLESSLDQLASSTADNFKFNLAYAGAGTAAVSSSGSVPPSGVDVLVSQVASLPALGTSLFNRAGNGGIAQGASVVERDAQGNVVAQTDLWFDSTPFAASSRIVFVDLVIPPPSASASVPAIRGSMLALLALALSAAGAIAAARRMSRRVAPN